MKYETSCDLCVGQSEGRKHLMSFNSHFHEKGDAGTPNLTLTSDVDKEQPMREVHD